MVISDTRWDVYLVQAITMKLRALGPNFRLTDVNFYDMNVSEATPYAGLNVHIVAEVGDYNSNFQLFELKIISMSMN